MLTSTTGDIAGFRTVQNFGVVEADILKGAGTASSVVGAVQTLLGGDLSAYESTIESARKEAFEKMCDQAGRKGANAVIGMRYEIQGYNLAGIGALEVLCYGTAVLVAPQ